MSEVRTVDVQGESPNGQVAISLDNAGRIIVSPLPVGVIGYESLTIAASSVGLSAASPVVPKSFVGVLETAQVRFRGDGTAPTATEGVVMEVGDQITLTADEIVNMRFFRTGGTSGVLKGHFFDVEIDL